MSHSRSKVIGIIPAGGSGTRMGLPVPKQLMPWKGKPLMVHTVNTLEYCVDQLVIAYPEAFEGAFRDAFGKRHKLVPGGRTRFESVRLAFQSLSDLNPHDLILIHDAARPFLDPSRIEDALDQARQERAVVYAVPCTDTVKYSCDGYSVKRTLDRNTIFLAQTPQIFEAALLETCYAECGSDWAEAPTDEAAMVEACGYPVTLFESNQENRKITVKEDLSLLRQQTMRIGHGYDVHRFDSSRPLFLCGLEIPEGPGLLGHSDADVALHAIMDAILGALGLGDIGQHFPDSEAQFKDISSLELLRHVLDEMKAMDGTLVNVDVTLLAQIPKLSPHRETMCASLAGALELDLKNLNLKFTTTEGLGFIGEKKGMAAHCVVLLSIA